MSSKTTPRSQFSPSIKWDSLSGISRQNTSTRWAVSPTPRVAHYVSVLKSSFPTFLNNSKHEPMLLLTWFLQSWLRDRETDPGQDKLPFSPSSQNLDKVKKRKVISMSSPRKLYSQSLSQH